MGSLSIWHWFSFFFSNRCFSRFLVGNLSRFSRFVLSFLHTFFEALNGAAEVFAHVLKFAGTENQNMGKDLGGAVKGFKEGMKEAQDEPAKPAQVADQKPAEAPVAKEEAKPEEKKQA